MRTLEDRRRRGASLAEYSLFLGLTVLVLVVPMNVVAVITGSFLDDVAGKLTMTRPGIDTTTSVGSVGSNGNRIGRANGSGNGRGNGRKAPSRGQ